MPEPEITIRERVWTDNGVNGFYDTFLYEPSNTDERDLGSLFVAGALLLQRPSGSEAFLLNSIAAFARRSFYAPPSRSESLTALEYALRQVNSFLGKQAEEGTLDWFGNLHLVVGCLNENDVHIAHAGSPDILLVRAHKAHNIAAITETRDNEGENGHLRVFSAIASGTLNEGDIVAIGAPSFGGAHETIIAAASDTTEDFFTLLHRDASPPSYASILLDARTEHAARSKPFIETLEKNFTETTGGTAEPLSLQEITNTPPAADPPLIQKSETPNKETKTPLLQNTNEEEMSLDARPVSAAVRITDAITRPTLASPSTTTKVMRAALTNGAALATKTIVRGARRYPFNIAGIGAVAGLALLAFTITSSPNQAPGLIAAESERFAASPLLAISTASPVTIADVSGNPFGFSPAGIVPLLDGHILYSNNSGSLYRVVKDQEPQFVLFAANDGFRAAAANNNAVLLFGDTGSLFFYGEEQRPPVNLPLSYSPRDVMDVAAFGDALYLLSGSTVYKYSKTDAGSYEETIWVTTDVNATSFAVDGSIYIADTNGVITEYFRGNRINTIKTTIPAGTRTILITTSDMPILIAVAPSEKTVTIIEKETSEQRVIQLVHPGTILSAAFNSNANTLYLLSETAVSEVILQ